LGNAQPVAEVQTVIDIKILVSLKFGREQFGNFLEPVLVHHTFNSRIGNGFLGNSGIGKYYAHSEKYKKNKMPRIHE
jgi:hypothetical protein